jgi:hypothetical protein
MRIRTMVAGGALVIGALLGLAVPAVAAPGVCTVPPGTQVSQNAHLPGPNAGPNSATQWTVAPGAPNTPGQQVKNLCINPVVPTTPPALPAAP